MFAPFPRTIAKLIKLGIFRCIIITRCIIRIIFVAQNAKLVLENNSYCNLIFTGRYYIHTYYIYIYSFENFEKKFVNSAANYICRQYFATFLRSKFLWKSRAIEKEGYKKLYRKHKKIHLLFLISVFLHKKFNPPN